MCKCGVERSHPLPLRTAEHQQPVMEGIHMLWPLSVNPKQSNQQPTAVTAWNVVCLFPILVLFILLFPIRAGTDCNVLSVPNHNIWRVPVCQRHCQEVRCTGERGNLRSNGSHAWPAARKSCQTSMCTTTTFLVIRTHIYTPPPPPLPSKCFYLLAQLVIHFWKLEVPEGRYQIEKHGFLLLSTTNWGGKMSEEQKNNGFEGRRKCTVTYKTICHVKAYVKGSRLSFLNANVWESPPFFSHAEMQKLERMIQESTIHILSQHFETYQN